VLERHLAIGVCLAGDGLIEPVIVEEVAGNPHARERDARFALHHQLGLRLGGPLIAKGRAPPLHLDTGHLDAIAGARLARNQFHQALAGLADNHPGQDLPACVHRSGGSEDASGIGRRNESSEVLQETARTGRDLPGTLNRGRDVLGIVDRTDAGRARAAGPYEPDLLPSPVVVAERVDKVLRPGVDQEASLVAHVVEFSKRKSLGGGVSAITLPRSPR
jgi:hypothetical protein